MKDVFLVILPLFLIIFGAAILQKTKLNTDNWIEVLNSFALNIGFPTLIFSALSKLQVNFTEQINIIIANSLFLIGSFILVLLLQKIFKFKKALFLTLLLCVPFGNVAYLGIPVLTQVWGTQILPSASLIAGVYLFWMFTLFISYLEYANKVKESGLNIIKNLFTNPLLLAVLFGLIFANLRIPIPAPIDTTISMIAASVTPIVLIVIGLFIGKTKTGKLKEWTGVLFFTLVTLLLLPAAFYFFVRLFHFNIETFAPSIIDSAMPLAITPFALAKKYKLDENFIARSIVLSTILSIITLPFWLTIM
ncbi:hypothetical protein GF340_01450 [Candidatus Peregrinibacteria bacterium]|nr:hypothetical protein [Candidatus Peregrinibacteria bacterium]